MLVKQIPSIRQERKGKYCQREELLCKNYADRKTTLPGEIHTPSEIFSPLCMLRRFYLVAGDRKPRWLGGAVVRGDAILSLNMGRSSLPRTSGRGYEG